MELFAKLQVWQKAHALSLAAHAVAGKMRGPENAALRSQLTRAAFSIPTNIVEGRGQRSDREFSRFLRIAVNSGSELHYHLIVAHDRKLISDREFVSLRDQTTQVRKMLHGLLKRVSAPSPVIEPRKKKPEVM
jgi:four helix bundle protein